MSELAHIEQSPPRGSENATFRPLKWIPKSVRSQLAYDEESITCTTDMDTADAMSCLLSVCVHHSCAVVDVTACIGGNTLALQKVFKQVSAVEADPRRVEMLINNLTVAGARAYVVEGHVKLFAENVSRATRMLSLPRRPSALVADFPCHATNSTNGEDYELNLHGVSLTQLMIGALKGLDTVQVKVPGDYNYFQLVGTLSQNIRGVTAVVARVGSCFIITATRLKLDNPTSKRVLDSANMMFQHVREGYPKNAIKDIRKIVSKVQAFESTFSTPNTEHQGPRKFSGKGQGARGQRRGRGRGGQVRRNPPQGQERVGRRQGGRRQGGRGQGGRRQGGRGQGGRGQGGRGQGGRGQGGRGQGGRGQGGRRQGGRGQGGRGQGGRGQGGRRQGGRGQGNQIIRQSNTPQGQERVVRGRGGRGRGGRGQGGRGQGGRGRGGRGRGGRGRGGRGQGDRGQGGRGQGGRGQGGRGQGGRRQGGR
jgi:hypothetical protein